MRTFLDGEVAAADWFSEDSHFLNTESWIYSLCFDYIAGHSVDTNGAESEMFLW